MEERIRSRIDCEGFRRSDVCGGIPQGHQGRELAIGAWSQTLPSSGMASLEKHSRELNWGLGQCLRLVSLQSELTLQLDHQFSFVFPTGVSSLCTSIFKRTHQQVSQQNQTKWRQPRERMNTNDTFWKFGKQSFRLLALSSVAGFLCKTVFWSIATESSCFLSQKKREHLWKESLLRNKINRFL